MDSLPLDELRQIRSNTEFATHPSLQHSSFTKHFDIRESILDVKNASFVVQTKKGARKILDNITFAVKSGQLFAMMGPSGAGKTTLLEFMTLELNGKPSGQVMLDGAPFTMEMFRKHAAFVEQYDNHRAFLTCREIMHFAAALCVVDPGEAKTKAESIMEKLGLLECGNTRAGNMFIKGLSGGQRKRLSLGMNLLKAPKVLFLDEPTTGLDAAGAERIITYLEISTKESNTITIFTIHQPATKVFMQCSNVLFLANGRMAYCGSPADLSNHCSTIGDPVPAMTNPADYFLEIINSEFNGAEKVDERVARFQPLASITLEGSGRDRGSTRDFDTRPMPGVVSQCCTILRREFLLSIRDPSRYVGRCFAFPIAGCFFALVYIKARVREQESSQPKLFLTAWFIGPPAMLALVNVYTCSEGFKLARKDLKNGMGSVFSYFISVSLLPIPFMFLLAVLAFSLPAHTISNFDIGGFPQALLLYAITLFCYESLAELMAFVGDNPLIGMFGHLAVWLTSFLFLGLYLSPDRVIWPFKIFIYIMPLRYCLRSLVHIEYSSEKKWDKAAWDNSNSSPMLICEDPAYCYGITGKEVMTTLKNYFGVVDPEANVANDMLVVLAIGMVFKVAAISLAVVKFKLRY